MGSYTVPGRRGVAVWCLALHSLCVCIIERLRPPSEAPMGSHVYHLPTYIISPSQTRYFCASPRILNYVIRMISVEILIHAFFSPESDGFPRRDDSEVFAMLIDVFHLHAITHT
ncbi:hypothetical protein F5Y12DRAFT_635114 [Xylaria sp. FL1777]|nr:hypothetical protein F5Y12DRAFT_635114 [Xylaria sp. FL1777]